MKPRAKASLLKRSTLEAKEEVRKYREEVDAEFKSRASRGPKQIESRLTECKVVLTTKDDNLTNKEKTFWSTKNRSLTDKPYIDAREAQVAGQRSKLSLSG